jgi:hypothetical protein
MAKLASPETPREFLCVVFAKMVFWLLSSVLFQKKAKRCREGKENNKDGHRLFQSTWQHVSPK